MLEAEVIQLMEFPLSFWSFDYTLVFENNNRLYNLH